MHKHTIAQLSKGREIYINLITSPAGKYISHQPYVIQLIKEALSSVKPKGKRMAVEHDMGRVIGHTDIIKTTDKDTIFYARPIKQDVFSRYAKNRYPKPSRRLTLVLEQDDNGDYELYDTWIGPHSPPFPGHEKATAKSKTYWENHALAQDAQPVQSKTITKECPY